MTDKLTAKLSDGTEWEVAHRSGWSGFCAADPNAQYWTVKPIKREPREWWVVYDFALNMNAMFGSAEAATDHYIANKDLRKKPFLVREVLE